MKHYLLILLTLFSFLTLKAQVVPKEKITTQQKDKVNTSKEEEDDDDDDDDDEKEDDKNSNKDNNSNLPKIESENTSKSNTPNNTDPTLNPLEQLSQKLAKQDSLKPNIEKKEKSFFKVYSSFVSNYSYNGRVDSIPMPYINSSVGYHYKEIGSITVGSFYSLLNTDSKFERFSIDAEYTPQFTDSFSGSFYANKMFYNDDSSFMTSTIKGLIGAYLEYEFDWFVVGIENNLLFSEKKDFSFAPSIYRDFNFLDEDKLTISPMFLLNFSTLHYYEGFASKKRKKIINPKNTSSVTNSVTTVDNSNFRLLNYEITAPAEYEWGNFVFVFTPTLAIPIHPIYTTTTNTTTTTKVNGTTKTIVTEKDSTEPVEKNLKPVFYFEIGCYYTF